MSLVSGTSSSSSNLYWLTIDPGDVGNDTLKELTSVKVASYNEKKKKKSIKKWLRGLSPGHGVVLHSWYSCAGPEHVVPPYFGLGFVQVRLRLRTPELQSRVHWVHELQTDQPPFTVSPETRPDRSTSPETHARRDRGWVRMCLCWTEDTETQIQCWFMRYLNWCLVINIALWDWAEMSSRKIYSIWDKCSRLLNAARVITRSQQHFAVMAKVYICLAEAA